MNDETISDDGTSRTFREIALKRTRFMVETLFFLINDFSMSAKFHQLKTF